MLGSPQGKPSFRRREPPRFREHLTRQRREAKARSTARANSFCSETVTLELCREPGWPRPPRSRSEFNPRPFIQLAVACICQGRRGCNQSWFAGLVPPQTGISESPWVEVCRSCGHRSKSSCTSPRGARGGWESGGARLLQSSVISA